MALASNIWHQATESILCRKYFDRAWSKNSQISGIFCIKTWNKNLNIKYWKYTSTIYIIFMKKIKFLKKKIHSCQKTILMEAFQGIKDAQILHNINVQNLDILLFLTVGQKALLNVSKYWTLTQKTCFCATSGSTSILSNDIPSWTGIFVLTFRNNCTLYVLYCGASAVIMCRILVSASNPALLSGIKVKIVDNITAYGSNQNISWVYSHHELFYIYYGLVERDSPLVSQKMKWAVG